MSFRRLPVLAGAGIAILFFSFLFIAANPSSGDLPSFWDPVPHDELAAHIVGEMTDEEQLAQILMFGWAGLDPSPQVRAWVEHRSLGSIKVFGWNTDDTIKVAESVSQLQKLASKGRFAIPLFVATDQEGGWIRHIKGLTSETPGNLALGASGIPMDAWYAGYHISRELRALGINLNFAPTLDLYTDHESTVIGPRSFGEDPVAAGILGAAFMAGSREAGVLTTAKHFPGHGDTGIDSHGRLPVIRVNRKTFYERELAPFITLIRSGVPAVMSGHLSFPEAVGNGTPATFSSIILKDILRDELGFTGLVITDDMMMNGATQYAGSVSRAVRMAIEAGNDIIESSTTPPFNDSLWTNSLNWMKSSDIFRQRVRESAERVVRTKLAYFKDENAVPVFPDVQSIPRQVPDTDGHPHLLSQAVRSVTSVRKNRLPIAEGTELRVLLAGGWQDFKNAGKLRFPEAAVESINSQLPAVCRSYDTVIFCLSNAETLSVLKRMEHLRDKIIVISILSPVYLNEVPWVRDALAVYSYSPWSFTAAFAAIRGDFEPTGIMPVKDVQ